MSLPYRKAKTYAVRRRSRAAAETISRSGQQSRLADSYRGQSFPIDQRADGRRASQGAGAEGPEGDHCAEVIELFSARRADETRVSIRSRLTGSEAGMATAEYAIATLAAVGFAGLLVVILRSDEVRGFLLSLIQQALSF